MSTETKYKCADCDRDLDGDECYETEDGSIYCQACYYDNQAFQCTLCDEHEEQQYQHNVLAIYSPDECFRREGKEPGLYHITGRPYYADGMIEGYIFDDRVTRVAPLPDGAVEGCYPAGHLCRACVAKHVPQCSRSNGADQPRPREQSP